MRSTCLYLEAQRVVALRLRCAVSHLTPSSVTRRRSQRRCNICGAIGRRASSDIFSSRRSNVSASQYCGSSVVIAKGPIVVAKWWSVLVAQFGKFVRLGSKGRAWALRKGAPCAVHHSDFGSRLEGLPALEENRVGGATYPLPLNSLAHARKERRWSARRAWLAIRQFHSRASFLSLRAPLRTR